MTLRVVAHFTTRPETVEETKTLLMGFIAPTRQEAGCISYQLYGNNANPTELTFVEEWTSEEALNQHLQSAHLTAGLAKLPPLLAAPPDIRRYTLIA